MTYRVLSDVAYRTGGEPKPPPNPVEYEQKIYQKGLQYERPTLSFQTNKWEELAEGRMSAESKGMALQITLG